MGVPEKRELRVGDHERQAVIDQLRAHLGAGRLELDEFEDRTAQALAARTVGDLVPLTADLPDVRTSTKGPPIRQVQPKTGWDKAFRVHAGIASMVALLLFVIWGFTFAWGIWIAIFGVGFTVAIHGVVKKAVEG
jgi:hypothetical protein